MGKDGRCIGLTTLPPSCADCLEILEPQPLGTPRACSAFTNLRLVTSQKRESLNYTVAEAWNLTTNAMRDKKTCSEEKEKFVLLKV
jgi:hypothetical protein